MVAPTFPNLSFENPPGTGPTLVSGSAEPFAFSTGDVLEITYAGITESVVLLDTDFADITNATADEVAQLLEARVDDLGASNDGGFVRLTALLTGEDISLEVAVGGANTVLNFPAGAVTGETYAGGPPNGWSVLDDTGSVYEWAEWADENGRPEEVFDETGWTVAFVSEALESAIFDSATIPTPLETFTGWSTTGLLFAFAAESASFGTSNEAFENFEREWGLPTYFAFTPINLLFGIAPEDFETGWGQVPSPSFSADTTFANGTKNAEDFENVLTTTHVVQIITAAQGEWRVNLDNEVYVYEALVTDNISIIAANLAAAVTGSTRFNATAFGSIISIFPTDPADTQFNVTAGRPAFGTFAVFNAVDFPLFAEEWIGTDINPDF